MLSQLKSKDGLTLIETVISTFLLAFGLAVSLVAVGVAMHRAASAENRMEAMHVARNEIERLRLLPFNADEMETGSHTINTNSFTGTYIVTSTEESVKDVILSVNYYDSVGRKTETVDLSTSLSAALR